MMHFLFHKSKFTMSLQYTFRENNHKDITIIKKNKKSINT